MMEPDDEKPRVAVIMGSQSDWATMRHASETLTELGISHEVQVVSAHRTPELMFEFAAKAEGRGIAERLARPVHEPLSWSLPQ